MSATGLGLDDLRSLGLLGPLDLHFARTLGRIAGGHDGEVELAAALASRQVGRGHVCLSLDRLCRGELALDVEAEVERALRFPDLEDWQRSLRASPLVGDGSQPTPLVLDAWGRLYLQRYHAHEQSLAAALRERAAAAPPRLDGALLERGLDRLFGPAPRAGSGAGDQLGLAFGDAPPVGDGADLQRAAAAAALRTRLCIISGGPGTGKTSTVVKILALVAEQRLARGQDPARTHLMAPTGKAAQRLTDSIRRAKAALDCQEAVRDAVAEEASTVHRALGVRGGGRGFVHDAERPLATDLVVVDEASMVDLALMARLFEAVPASARVILLGDRDQLASVEAGAVLGDICGAGLEVEADSPLSHNVIHLRHSYRYGEDSGIGQLARAINAARPEQVLDILADGSLPDVRWVEADPVEGRRLHPDLAMALSSGLGPYLRADSPAQRLERFEAFRILCAHRHGPYGLVALNGLVEALLRERGELEAEGPFYAGRPILIGHNDYQARLYNGDVGVLARDPQGGLGAYFPTGRGEPRRVSPARLPAHETAFATSVHKSQGSEFDRVVVVLPADTSRLLSRELLYTAVTRARRQVVIFGSEQAVRVAVTTAVERASGLRQALRTSGSDSPH